MSEARRWLIAMLRALRRLPVTVRDEADGLRWEAMKLATLEALEREAIRTIDSPAGRLYEMPDGRLVRWQGWFPVPVSEWDAEDFYGWKRQP